MIQEEKPPYVNFEKRPVEDRDGSIASGHYCAKDVDFAIITPSGSRDKIERIATEWLAHIKEQCRQGRFPQQWVSHYEHLYAAWQEGMETPLDGTPLNNWGAISPSQLKMLFELRIRTIEDLASCNEETIRHLGMGGRSLKDKAVHYLAASKDIGVVTQRISALEIEASDLKARNKVLEDENKKLAAQVQALTPKTQGAVSK